MATFKVIGRPLNHNGRALAVGDPIELPEADGALLAARGCVEPADVVAEYPVPQPTDDGQTAKKKSKAKKGA